MQEPPKPPNGIRETKLTRLADDEQRDVMRRWRHAESGMDGERSGLPEKPDDPVAYKLLDAAGDAVGRGDWRQGVNVLRLIVKDYRHSREAACARQIIDRLAERSNGR